MAELIIKLCYNLVNILKLFSIFRNLKEYEKFEDIYVYVSIELVITINLPKCICVC